MVDWKTLWKAVIVKEQWLTCKELIRNLMQMYIPHHLYMLRDGKVLSGCKTNLSQGQYTYKHSK